LNFLTKCLQSGDKLELFNFLSSPSFTVVPFNVLNPGCLQNAVKQTKKTAELKVSADGSEDQHHGLLERDAV
jgi:hypothetical protein